MEIPIVHVHQELINRCRQGDSKSYYQLYKLYSRSMYNVGYRILNDEADAQDVLQEAFISAFNNLESYRGDSAFGAWLKRIVINKAITHATKRKFERFPEHEQWEVSDDEPRDIFDNFPFTVEKVKAAIHALPDGYRTVLSLYLLEGYDHGEIGEIMGISESTSKSQYNRSKKKLKEILEQHAL